MEVLNVEVLHVVGIIITAGVGHVDIIIVVVNDFQVFVTIFSAFWAACSLNVFGQSLTEVDIKGC